MGFEVSLTPSEVVPPADGPAAGFGDIQLRQSANERTIIVAIHPMPRADPGGSISFDPLTVSAVHIHQGAAGMNGPLLWAVPNPDQHAPTDVVSAAFAYDGTMPFDDLWTTLATDAAYVDVHTTAFPDGQIRGALANRDLRDWYCPSPN